MTKRPNFRYRLLYQRGQLSVGERLYQSVMPGFQPPRADAWVSREAVFAVNGAGNGGIFRDVSCRLYGELGNMMIR